MIGAAPTGLQRGELGKQLGLELVASNAEEFLEIMRDEAERIARSRGQVCVDDLRFYARKLGIEPHHPNAWGALFSGSAWVRVGYKKSTFPASHSRTITVWELRG